MYTFKEKATISILKSKGLKISFREVNGVIVFKKDCEITQTEITKKAQELESQAKTTDTQKALQTLCDTKSVQAKTFIAGKVVTVEQLARYDEKYQIATEYKANGNYTYTLKLEADLQGLTVDELSDLILIKGNDYKQALITFNARIEAFRVAVSKLISDGDLDKANEVITKAKELGASATDEDIKGLFA
jgi:hypothetical protein